MIRRLLPLLMLPVLAACGSHPPAPVSDLAPPAATANKPAAAIATGEAKPGFYSVKKGDTLYSIALDHGQAYRDVAAWNSLDDPNRIQIGQQLRVVPPDSAADSPVAVTRPVTSAGAVEVRPLGSAAPTAAATTAIAANGDALKRAPKGGKLPYSEQALAQMLEADTALPVVPPKPTEAHPPEKPPISAAPPVEDGVDWAWPTGGRIAAGFVEGSSKGVDLAGKSGDPVLAAGEGKVAYVGTGMRGYGKMVIVKHSALFLSVYAHNNQILVKEGQTVVKGQKIAEVGSTDTDQPKLHFEIRRQGKPVDPLKYLPAR